MNNEISESQKNAVAIMLMQRVVEKYSEKESISIDEAITRFASTLVYEALFDFDTGLWKEGPDYILALVKKEGLG